MKWINEIQIIWLAKRAERSIPQVTLIKIINCRISILSGTTEQDRYVHLNSFQEINVLICTCVLLLYGSSLRLIKFMSRAQSSPSYCCEETINSGKCRDAISPYAYQIRMQYTVILLIRSPRR